MNLVSIKQVSPDFVHRLFKQTDLFKPKPWATVQTQYCSLEGKVLGILKDEPSTRTRISFEVAMKRLGGEVVQLDMDSSSSIAKGESFEDTVKVFGQYVDGMIIRCKRRGAVEEAIRLVDIPVINAGDGDGEHPTQALLDLYTMGEVKNKRILIAGDLRYGRAVHSLVNLMGLFDVEVRPSLHFFSPVGLELPDEQQNWLREVKTSFTSGDDLPRMIKETSPHIVYLTRLQTERQEQLSARPYFIFDQECLGSLRKDCQILHPLPRGTELPVEIDSDPRAGYFEQARNGLFVRMALLWILLH